MTADPVDAATRTAVTTDGKQQSVTRLAPGATPQRDTTEVSERRSRPQRVAPWRRPFTALEERDFRNLWLGMLPGTMAMQMGVVTTGYVAYDISRSAASVSYVSLGMGIPMLFLGLFGGVVADRFPKRRTLMFTQSFIGLAAAVNAILVLTGVIQIWHLFLISAMQGTAFAFNMPSRQAFVAQLVSKERLMPAIALNQAGMNFSRVIGPSIAGALIAVPFIGAGGVYVIMTAMYAYVVLSLTRIPHAGAPHLTRDQPSPLRSLGDGLRYVRGNSIVFTLLMLAFVPVLLGMPYQALMPVFARDVFDVGSGGLGLLLTFNGIGALAGSLLVASITTFQRRGLLQMALGITFGLSIAVFAFGQSFYIGLASLLVVGLVSAGFQSLNSTLVMNATDQAYHGRVMSVYMLTFSAMPLGVVPFGWLSDHYGAPISIGIGGLLLAGIFVLVGLVHPSFRKIK